MPVQEVYADLDFPGVPVPLYRGKPWFLPIVGEYYRYLDRKERRAAINDIQNIKP